MINKKKAQDVVRRCHTNQGFYAGDYYIEYWTRDFAFSIESLLDLGYEESCRNHLELLLRHNRNGEIPTVVRSLKQLCRSYFLSPNHLMRAATSPFEYKKLLDVFKLVSFLSTSFHEKTRDSGLWFLLALKIFEKRVGRLDEQVSCVKDFVFNNKIELIEGAGPYDVMTNYFHAYTSFNTALFSVVCKQYSQPVNGGLEQFWNEDLGYYTDILGGNRMELSSHALALAYDLIPSERVERILESIDKFLKTKFGYLNISMSYGYDRCSCFPYTYQNSTIWWFCETFLRHAFIRLGEDKRISLLDSMMKKRKSFNEWFAPFDGSPHGSSNFLASACGYLETSCG